MIHIEKQILSYEEIRKGIDLGSDPEGIGAYTQQNNLLETFLNNPFLHDESMPMVAFIRVDGAIWGRCMYFPTRIIIGDRIEQSLGGSSLLVNEEGRKYSFGVDLMMLPMNNHENKYLLYAGVSKMAYQLYKKLKFVIFEMPCRWQIRNSKPIFQSIGLKGVVLQVSSFFINIFLKLINSVIKLVLKSSIKSYSVKRLDNVPDWVVQSVLNDNHKYAEYHDKSWFDWVLNNNFFGRKLDSQSLFGVYTGNVPVAFILLGERQSSIEERNIDSVVFGSIIEWGILDQTKIDEIKLNTIALNLYSNNVDIVQVISSDKNNVNFFRRFGLINHGTANIVFKDLSKSLDNDYKDSNNWRLRVGYSDVPFY